MKTILVICKDYLSVKRKMNEIYEQYKPYAIVRLTDRIINLKYNNKIFLRYIFKTIDDYPERIMGIEMNMVFIDESAQNILWPEGMGSYLSAHTREGYSR